MPTALPRPPLRAAAAQMMRQVLAPMRLLGRRVEPLALMPFVFTK